MNMYKTLIGADVSVFHPSRVDWQKEKSYSNSYSRGHIHWIRLLPDVPNIAQPKKRAGMPQFWFDFIGPSWFRTFLLGTFLLRSAPFLLGAFLYRTAALEKMNGHRSFVSSVVVLARAYQLHAFCGRWWYDSVLSALSLLWNINEVKGKYYPPIGLVRHRTMLRTPILDHKSAVYGMIGWMWRCFNPEKSHFCGVCSFFWWRVLLPKQSLHMTAAGFPQICSADLASFLEPSRMEVDWRSVLY